LRIYLDNCCFNRPYDNQSSLLVRLETQAKLYIQSLVHDAKIELVWSYILDYEISFNPVEHNRNAISKWRELAVIDVEETPDLVHDANAIQKTGIKVKDSLHIASAIAGGADYFVTVDKRLLKYRDTKIIVCDTISLLNVLEGKL